jgi:hypothetical protein
MVATQKISKQTLSAIPGLSELNVSNSEKMNKTDDQTSPPLPFPANAEVPCNFGIYSKVRGSCI